MANSSSKPLCYAPWTGIEILPSGSILPCCKFRDDDYGDRYNITEHTIKDFRHSAQLKTVRDQMLQGEWPLGCERCRIEEQGGIESRRQLDYQRWQEHYDQYDLDSDQLLTIGMAFGNVCNLKCIMCNPYSSSRWQAEWQQIYGETVPKIDTFRREIIQGLADISSELLHLDIHGGEPFLSAQTEHLALLDQLIESGRAGEISIHYTTNGTIMPGEEWWQRWNHFREIDMQISADGIARRFEYIRFPADWMTFVKNVLQYIEHEKNYKNLRLSVAHTVSAFNVYYLDEFVTWCLAQGLPAPWMGRLHRPAHYRPTVWPKPVRDSIAQHLESSQHASVRAWAEVMRQGDDSEHFELFRQRVQDHDDYRGTGFQKTFKELAQYL